MKKHRFKTKHEEVLFPRNGQSLSNCFFLSSKLCGLKNTSPQLAFDIKYSPCYNRKTRFK